MTQIYNTGTVTVTNGSATVTGSGTAWAVALVTGGILSCAGMAIPILSVASDTSLTLAYPWPGTTGSGKAYAIVRETSDAANVVDLQTTVSRLLVTLSLAGITPNESGTIAERDAIVLGTGDKGFLFLHAEPQVAFAFYRWTGTSWQGPFPVADAAVGGPVSSLTAGNGIAVDSTNPAVPVINATRPGTAKTTPVDADEVSLFDSAASYVLKRLTWANVKAALKTYFDTLYTSTALVRREVLTANRTYYVRVDGSDSNTGLVNSAGGAFLTIQKAIDVVGALDISIYTVTIQVGDGTYTGGVALNGPWVGLGTVILQGNASTPTNVVISTASGVVPVSLTNKATLTLRNMKLQNAGGSASNIRVTTGAIITPTTGLHFGATGYACIDARAGGLVNASFLSANWTITTSVPRFLSITEGSLCSARFVTINVSGSYAWASQFAEVASAGLLNIDGVTWNITGTPTGKRYAVSQNGLCITGGGASYFPGDVAGTTSTQGQYL
ncbi:hypothetical protein MesoLj113c_14480 [Mesorhizobium sp. 113-3-9]|uniref:hypothetical protein n=1 Tax=Mesorhizobium sp. 113-3-9 TaxID=2744517 RepID=UPI0019286598|nr:hypothetical protein [Mesorhizobium sp. 113-3-9]BCG85338.1 hypothetical protein MesoLj113c_14480 [Mesorhizobium sp. 113-3-9]